MFIFIYIKLLYQKLANNIVMASSNTNLNYSILPCFLACLVAFCVVDETLYQIIFMILSLIFFYYLFQNEFVRFFINRLLYASQYKKLRTLQSTKGKVIDTQVFSSNSSNNEDIFAAQKSKIQTAELEDYEMFYEKNMRNSKRLDTSISIDRSNLRGSKNKKINTGYNLDTIFQNVAPKSSVIHSKILSKPIQNTIRFIPREYLQTQQTNEQKNKQLLAYLQTLKQFKISIEDIYDRYASVMSGFFRMLQKHNREQRTNLKELKQYLEKFYCLQVTGCEGVIEPEQSEKYGAYDGFKLKKSKDENIKITIESALKMLDKSLKSQFQIQPFKYRDPEYKGRIIDKMQQLMESRKQLDEFLKDLKDNTLQPEKRIQSIKKLMFLQCNFFPDQRGKFYNNLSSSLKKNYEAIQQLDIDNHTQIRLLLNFWVVSMEKIISSNQQLKSIRISLENQNIFTAFGNKIMNYVRSSANFFTFYLEKGYGTGYLHYNIKYKFDGQQGIICCAPEQNNIRSLLYFYLLKIRRLYDRQISSSQQLSNIMLDMLPYDNL